LVPSPNGSAFPGLDYRQSYTLVRTRIRSCLFRPFFALGKSGGLLKVNFGSRYRHKRGTDVEGEPAYPNGIHIYDALEAFNEYFPDGEKDKIAEEHHDYLSEFCHPNSDAFTNCLSSIAQGNAAAGPNPCSVQVP
jgi:hypothetical protein